MASSYYDSSSKDVSDGNVAYAADLNDINTAVDTALQLVEADIVALENNQPYYTTLAQKWAENPEDTEVTTGAYSALHWAAKADNDATTTAADRVQTGLDRTQTGLDAVATAADRVQTGLDAVATAADRVQTGLDAVATAADRVQTGLDATSASDSADDAAASLASMNKDGSDGVPGLTLFKINFMNALGTIKSFFTNSNTVARTYTLQDRDGTLADDTDLEETVAFTPGDSFIKLKNGLVICWGSETTNGTAETEKDHNLSYARFDSIYAFVAYPLNATANIDFRTYTLTTTTFKTKCSLATCAFRYIAIGYDTP